LKGHYRIFTLRIIKDRYISTTVDSHILGVDHGKTQFMINLTPPIEKRVLINHLNDFTEP
ncbi:MAG: hypothetical protein COX20_06545, partial [Desulfobacterales bacterium CG23_combo_of_CG06-09_8_20_14_all_52_9]